MKPSLKPDRNAPRTPGGKPSKPAIARVDIVRAPTVARATPHRVVHSSGQGSRVAGNHITGAGK